MPAALQVTREPVVDIRVGGQPAVAGPTAALRDVWEETSFALERLQVRRLVCWMMHMIYMV
jgi:hypothetical protein